jgi:hypothetical protein
MTIDASARRELRIVATAAAALVVFRSLVPLVYEPLFDSDQAIVGLMAKHLSEFRVFPLFFYGQHYMLGVQAWIAAPFFWLGGPTIAMLRLPLVIINAGVAIALIVMFSRAGMRPVLGLVAALPLIATTPLVSVELLAAIGASIEPFAALLLLWVLRTRPVAFGLVFCLAVLNREFVVFALPALVVAQWPGRRSWSGAGMAKGLGAFAATYLLVEALRRQVGIVGPPGSAEAPEGVALGARTVLSWLAFDWQPYAARLREVVTWGLPDLFGARAYRFSTYGLPTGLYAGSTIAGIALGGAALAIVVRTIWLAWRSDAIRRAGDSGLRLCVYLALVALQTILAYGLNSGIAVGVAPVLRYVLFALLLPIALFAAYFLIERSRGWRAAVAVAIGVWAATNVVDVARFNREFETAPPPMNRLVMASYLTARGIRYGHAGYFDAYIIVFLSRERVILASTDKVRIPAYQTRVAAREPVAVTLFRQPCGGFQVARWCVVEAASR